MSKELPFDVIAWRFNRYVSKTSEGGCWIWTGGRSRGYGVMRVGDRARKAHHVSLFVASGKWPPENRQVCHKCAVKLCVNPAHLYEGTVLDNTADRMAPPRIEPSVPVPGARVRIVI